MRVLVTGGAGYIGSVVTEQLIADGNEVVVYDNLSKGHREAVVASAELVAGELSDANTLKQTLHERKIEAVIHMAASSLVGESVEHPDKYYQNNVIAGLVLLEAMLACDVKRLVFSSTAATYGEPEARTGRPLLPHALQRLRARDARARKSSVFPGARRRA